MFVYLLPFPSCGGSVFNHIELASTDVVLDLGCGDGRWVIAAAEQRACTGRGYDLNEELLQKGRRAAAEAGVRHAVSYSSTFYSGTRVHRGVREVVLDTTVGVCQRRDLTAHYIERAPVFGTISISID